jgi:hypothetical protein
VTEQAERLRAALDTVFAGRQYRWAREPAPARLLHEWWDRMSDWLRALRADNPLVFRLLILGLLLVLVLILAHAAWLVWRTVRGAQTADAAEASAGTLEPRDAEWYSRAADLAAAEGRFADALQLAFVSLALGLDRQGLLQYHTSKTPAECARDARLEPADGARLRGLVRTLYLHAFGGRPAGLDEYRHWRAAGAEPWHAPAS